MVKFEWDEDKNESNIEKHGWILKMLPKFSIAQCLSRSIRGKIMVKTVGLVLVCWASRRSRGLYLSRFGLSSCHFNAKGVAT